MPKNINMTYLALLTIASPPSANVSVISPQRRANAGIAAPIASEAIEPMKIRMISALDANLKRWVKETFGTFCYFC